jgi:broad specificity phosphatase PhoE
VTRLLLVRHAAHDWLGRGLAGRLPGVGLNAQGQAQAHELARRLKTRVDTICSSPQQRALETAAPVAARLGLPVIVASEFDEIDFGQWTSRSMAELAALGAVWQEWVERRSTATPPGGEPFSRVATRVVAGAQRLHTQYPGHCILVFSHGDVIKALLASCLGLSLDDLERFDLAPASLSVIAIQGGSWQIKLVNQALTGPLLPP